MAAPGFSITIPNSINIPNLSLIVASLLLSVLIIYPILGLGNVQSSLSLVVLFILFYVIFSSMSNNNYQNELPSTIYPSMPHLGLDGVSINNYVSGMNL